MPDLLFQEETEPDGSTAAPAKGQIPAELLKAFEHNYRSRRRGRWMKYAAVSLTACLAVFAWYQASRRHDQGGAISRTLPARPAEQRPVAAPVPPAKKSTPTPSPAPSSAAIVQKAPPAPRKPAAGAATASRLPSFIPEKGRDSVLLPAETGLGTLYRRKPRVPHPQVGQPHQNRPGAGFHTRRHQRGFSEIGPG